MQSTTNSLITRQEDPFNAETPLGPAAPNITPVSEFYVRSHFPVPEISSSGGLRVGGAVAHEFTLSLDELQALPAATITTTMECAGNGRAFLSPPIAGVAWALGAVATAEWTGVPLPIILDRAEVLPEAMEIVFHGRDSGVPSRSGETCHFERSLPVSDPAIQQSFVAFAMNGQPLTPDHGAPIRLVVPGWYGMASVKWLDAVTAVTAPFHGFYQVDDYVMRSGQDIVPCREMAVRSLILNPANGARLKAGREVMVSGYAWAGAAMVDRVDVSTDGGVCWLKASVTGSTTYAWCRWSFSWTPETPGECSILVRASDAAGNEQPLTQVWNEGGYGNNCSIPTAVTVV